MILSFPARTRRALVALALPVALVPAAAIAQAAPAVAPSPTATVDADPALWAVSDADTTIYLFGTVHLLQPGLGWFDEGVAKAFDASSELMLELADPSGPDTQKAVMARAMATDGRTLSQRLTPDQRTRLDGFLERHKMPMAALDPLQPWLAGITVSIVPLMAKGFKPEAGVDTMLRNAAIKAGKTVTGLESSDEQVGFLANLPEAAQIDLLMSSVESGEQNAAMVDTIVAQWAKGDADGVGKTLNAALEPYPEVADAMLTRRNANWAVALQERLKKPGTVFVAVGAGHLAGKDSVQSMLAARGLTVRRVDY